MRGANQNPPKRVLALLDSMWREHGSGDDAPRFFRISQNNHSGRRLYSLVGEHNLLVTNSCREVQTSARGHGTPDPGWVAESLKQAEPFDLLLVCGRIAQATFARCQHVPKGAEILNIPHPAARSWSTLQVTKTRRRVAKLLAGGVPR